MNINFKGRIQVTAQESTSRTTGPYFYKFNSTKQQIKLVSRKLCTVKCIQVYFFHSEWPETPAPKCYSTLQVQYSTTSSWHDQQPGKEGKERVAGLLLEIPSVQSTCCQVWLLASAPDPGLHQKASHTLPTLSGSNTNSKAFCMI